MNELLKAVGQNSEVRTLISGISYNSSKTQCGDIFIAIRGFKKDGNKFIQQAIEKGAAAIVSERKIKKINVPAIKVKDARIALAQLSARFYGYPSNSMRLLGVTGTNGKTTITYLLEAMLPKSGVIGTINYRYNNKSIPASTTTPESFNLQQLFYSMKQDGAQNIIMEVSSHSLALNRVFGLQFDAAIFTNLTRDHFDFHKTVVSYYNAKRKLFTSLQKGTKPNRFAVVNTDDKYGRKIHNYVSKIKRVSYGIYNPADFTATDIKLSMLGTDFRILYNNSDCRIHTKLLGRFNVYNILAVFATVINLGIPAEKVVKVLNEVSAPPGRFEIINSGRGFSVVVDYAHTDDALRNVLLALNELKTGKIITVFGCGGDRDTGKRPGMGQVAGTISDFVIVTSDNPRTEDPGIIIEQVLKGLKKTKAGFEVISDRKTAIDRAVKMAGPGDIVLIAGKGHEDYQIIGETKVHFSDKEVVMESLKNAGAVL